MTLHFPEINVWIALTVRTHTHADLASHWLNQLLAGDRILFSRYTQLGLLRLFDQCECHERGRAECSGRLDSIGCMVE
jgi:predicted nucleic acid-binding protein